MKEAKFYGNDFYDEQEGESYISAREVVPILNELFSPKSVLDVGCGLGTWLKVWREDFGITDLLGLEGPYVNPDKIYIPKENIRFTDLKERISLHRKFDLVLSLEVGEHIPDDFADNFIDNIVSGGDIVVFSAAIPHQEGTFHINEQPAEYWSAKFERRGFKAIDIIRKRIWNNSKICYWYRQNMMVYIKDERVADFPELVEAAACTDSAFLTRIHPELLNFKVKRIQDTATIPAFVKWQLYLLKLRFKKIFK